MTGKVNKLRKFLVASVCALLTVSTLWVSNAQAYYPRRCPVAKNGRHSTVVNDGLSKRANCERSGYITYQCRFCKYTYNKYERRQKNKHLYTENCYKKVVSNPTCTKRGETKWLCLNGCGKWKSVYKPALGHSYTSYNHKTYKGRCTRCNGVYKLSAKQRKAVDAMLNNFGDGSFSSK